MLILFYAMIISSVSLIVFGIIGNITHCKFIGYITLGSFIILMLSLLTGGIMSCYNESQPDEQYRILKEDIEKSNKKLEHFLIDHPEIKDKEEK